MILFVCFYNSFIKCIKFYKVSVWFRLVFHVH